MQAFKLVNGGHVDRVIVFDSLPQRLIKNIRTREVAGFPRTWAKWLASIESTRPVYRTETSVDLARNWTFTHIPIGQEPCFYILEYTDLNADKEKWREICEYLRLNLGPEIRLKEKIEDMATALGPNPNAPLSVEPEDIPVIPVPPEIVKEPDHSELVKPGEQILVEASATKKRGRPKKIEVEA